MSTDPFQDITSPQEISQTTFVELITVSRITGQAIRTICDNTSGDLICEEGPPPHIRIKKLAYEKEITPPTRQPSRFVPSQQIIPQKINAYALNSKVESLSRETKIAKEFRTLVSNVAIQDACDVNKVVNGDFSERPSGIFNNAVIPHWTNNGYQVGSDVFRNDTIIALMGSNYVAVVVPMTNEILANAPQYKKYFRQTISGLTGRTKLQFRFYGFFSQTTEFSVPASTNNFLLEVIIQDLNGQILATEIFDSTDAPESGSSVILSVPESGEITVPNTVVIGFRAIIVGSGSITYAANPGAVIDDVEMCETQEANEEGCSIGSVSSTIEWNGKPHHRMNIFSTFIRYQMREFSNPFVTYAINQKPISTGHDSAISGFCSLWVQPVQFNQATSGVPLTDDDILHPVTNVINASNGDIVDVRDKVGTTAYRQWIYGIPYDPEAPIEVSQQPEPDQPHSDFLVTAFPYPEENYSGREVSNTSICQIHDEDPEYVEPGDSSTLCVVQSVQVFYLMQVAINETEIEADIRCLPDPTDTFDVVLTYVNRNGQNKEFRKTIDVEDLYVQDQGEFDEQLLLAQKYPNARWEMFEFLLDLPTGTGLDQCSEAVIDEYSFTGTGSLAFSGFNISANSGFSTDPCVPSIEITEIRGGSAINEIQSIILPTPTGGTYELSFTYNNVTDSTIIPWNAPAAQVRVRLGNLSSIGSTQNIAVNGSGTTIDPFTIEFKGDLSATDLPLIEADNENLVGTASGIFTTIRNGTLNERQRITNAESTRQPFKLTFNNQTTVDLAWNTPIATMQSALEGLSTIGEGNVQVIGFIADREVAYSGPWLVDFIGDFAGQNVPLLEVNNDSYFTSADWNGGIGVDEIQELTINATDGKFAIIMFDPDSSDTFATTGQIDYNASASVIKSAMTGAADWISSNDLTVTKTSDNTWEIIFRNSLGKINIRQCEVNANQLQGPIILVNEIQNGGGHREQQSLKILDTTSGTFTLKFGNETTEPIKWDANRTNIANALWELDNLSQELVTVSGTWPNFVVYFDKSFGDIELLVANTANLECDGFAIKPVPKPPYTYDPGRPGDGDPLPSDVLIEPIPSEANVYIRNQYQRYLFDPKGGTNKLSSLAHQRGIDVSKFTPYLMDCNSNLIPSSFSTIAHTQQSYILIENTIDSGKERQRIIDYLNNNQRILPSRFVWDCLEI